MLGKALRLCRYFYAARFDELLNGTFVFAFFEYQQRGRFIRDPSKFDPLDHAAPRQCSGVGRGLMLAQRGFIELCSTWLSFSLSSQPQAKSLP